MVGFVLVSALEIPVSLQPEPRKNNRAERAIVESELNSNARLIGWILPTQLIEVEARDRGGGRTGKLDPTGGRSGEEGSMIPELGLSLWDRGREVRGKQEGAKGALTCR